MTKDRGHGRPPAEYGTRLDKALQSKVTEDEEKLVREIAAKAGLTVSQWVRKLVVAALAEEAKHSQGKLS